MIRLILSLTVPLVLLVLPMLANAESGIPAVTLTTGENGEQSYTVTLQILALMTVLTLLPAALMMMTSFTRIIIVLAILRQAMGIQSTPSNQVLIGCLNQVVSSSYFNAAMPEIRIKGWF